MSAGEAPRPHVRAFAARHAITLVAAALSLACAAATGTHLMQEREQALSRARTEATAAADALAVAGDGILRGLALDLAPLERIAARRAGGTEPLMEAIRQTMESVPLARGIAVLDADGATAAALGEEATIRRLERTAAAHRLQSLRSAWLQRPGDLVLPARSIDGSDGCVIAVALDLAVIERRLRDIAPAHAALSLHWSDPAGAEDPWGDARPAIADRIDGKAASSVAPPADAPQAPGPATMRRLGSQPLAVRVSIPEDAALAAWRRQALGSATVALAACLAMMLFAWLAHRRTLQSALQDSRLRDAVDSISDSWTLFDRDERLVLANAAFAEAASGLGVPPVPGESLESMLRRMALSGAVKAAVGRPEAWVAERIAELRGPPIGVEQQLKSGRRKLARHYRSAIGDLVITRTDITALVSAERALRDSEARFRDFARASGDWFWETDANLRYTLISPEFDVQYGLPARSFLGTPRGWRDRVPFWQEDGWDAHLAVLARREPFRGFRYRAMTAHGVRWLSQSGIPVFDADGRFAGYRGSCQDVTDVVALEERAREAGDLLRYSIETFDAALSISDPDDRLILTNARFRALNAATGGAIDLGKPYMEHVRWSLERGHYAIPQSEAQAWLDDRQRRRRQPEAHAELKRADGSWWLVHDHRLPNGCTVTLAIDVSERRAAQSQREELEARLKLSERLSLLGVVAGGVAHEINNVLTPILMFASVLKDRLPAGHFGRSDLDKIIQAAQRGRDIARTLRVQARQDRKPLGPVDLNHAVTEAAGLVEHSLRPGVRLLVSLSTSPCVVLGDATQLVQCLVNLIVNASDAMAASGGRIAISLAPLSVAAGGPRLLDPMAPGPAHSIIVEDTGSGMNEATLARASEPFFSTKPGDSNSGLGLSIVRDVMRGHGGSLAIASAPGKGTTVRLVLPRLEGPVPAVADNARPAATRAAEGQRVLVVDDDPLVLESLTMALRHGGFEAMGALSPGAAIDMAREHLGKIAAAVLDLAMPEMSGLALARRLRETMPSLPIVVVTGRRTASLTGEIAACGISSVLDKPVSPAQLVAAVLQLVTRVE
ncbi:MAG: PAS-domain containing protein [Alphaproteobacteria bacterium]|nr:PAS-domain containing protein [Alphaproteobacteria bacterium]